MLDRIEEIIEDIATDEKGVHQEVIDFLTPKIPAEKHYIVKMQTLGIKGEAFLKDFNYWETKYKVGAQSFGNYVEFCQERIKRQKGLEQFIMLCREHNR